MPNSLLRHFKSRPPNPLKSLCVTSCVTQLRHYASLPAKSLISYGASLVRRNCVTSPPYPPYTKWGLGKTPFCNEAEDCAAQSQRLPKPQTRCASWLAGGVTLPGWREMHQRVGRHGELGATAAGHACRISRAPAFSTRRGIGGLRPRPWPA
jgi:hypothetical protein